MSIEALTAVIYAPSPEGGRHVGALTVFRVLTVLAEHAGPDGEGACPSQSTIADAIGSDRRSVRAALELLEAGGRIVRTGDAIPRVRGVVYRVALGTDQPDSHVDCGGESPPESQATSGRELGRGIPATNLNLNLKTPPLPPNTATTAAVRSHHLEQRSEHIIKRAADIITDRSNDVRSPVGYARNEARKLREDHHKWTAATALARWPIEVPIDTLANHLLNPTAGHLTGWQHLNPDGHPDNCPLCADNDNPGIIYDASTNTSRPCPNTRERMTA